jgi:GGDEF domain-containing protein
MNNRFSWIFLAVSGAFFVFIVGLTGYRIEDARRQNAAFARGHLPQVAAMTAALGEATGGYDSPQFKKNMRDLFDAEPRLLVLSLHSSEQGMLYLISRNKTYVREPAALSPAWRGTPVYQVSKGYELLLSAHLGNDPAKPTLDALFIIMGREDLYPVMRDDLYLFLAFLLVCGVVILIVMSMEQDSASPRRRANRPSSPSGSAAPATPDRMGQRPAPAQTPAHGATPSAPSRAEAVAEGSAEPVRALTSPRTGLVWAEYLEPRLRAEIERAASTDQDLVLARIRIDEPFADAKLPMVYAELARMLKESFPLHDLIFESGNDSYTLLIPDTDIDAGVRILEDFRKKVEKASIEAKKRTVSIGASSRGGRLIEERTVLEEVDVSMAKASREGGNQVVGFRADPARFRDTLSGSRA